MKHWYRKHKESLSFGQKVADIVATTMGSWSFIIGQSLFLAGWVALNSYYPNGFDPPPFIGLNLLLSFEAAFAAPFIMISQNRQGERDRHQADADYKTNVEAEERIEQLQKHLAKIEIDKLDKILERLNDTKTVSRMGVAQIPLPRS